MRALVRLVVLTLLVTPLAVASPAPGGPPRTLAATAPVGAAPVDPDFPIDFVGVLHDGDVEGGAVRFRHGATWSGWTALVPDGVEAEEGFASALVAAGDADAYQVRLPAGAPGARAVALNTTDGPRRAGAAGAHAGTSVVTRATWGAEESLMTWAPAYHPTQKLTVHHTATANGDADPAATVRAIYRYHAVDRNFGDIGYQYLVDEVGRVYEGRWSGTDGDAAHDASGRGVTAAHVGGYNSANTGVAVLGTLTSQEPTAAARSAVEQLLGELAARHGLDPHGSATYVNPVNGVTATVPNISGHRDWEATECPGGAFYALLPAIRDAAAAIAAGTPPGDTTAPVVSDVRVAAGSTTATVHWATNEPATSQVQHRRSGTATWVSSAATSTLVTAHRVELAGLARKTRYDYRVVSTDAAGNTAVGAVSTFTTKR